MRFPAFCLALLAAAFSAHADDSAGTTAPAATAPQSTATAPAAATTTPAAGAAAGSNEEPATQQRIYLLARIKLNGTDLTQVVFLRSDAITSMEDCEAERNAGMTTGWVHYSRYYLKTLKGISYKVDYRCMQSDLHLDYWHRGNPMDTVYLVHTENGKLSLQTYSNFFRCRDALRSQIGRKAEETMDAFCGISSQNLLKDTEDTGGTDDSEDADAAPSPAH
jgi:hypothetical protein